IVNPLFLLVFLGTGLACLLVVIGALLSWGDPRALLLALGGGLYLVGGIVVTMVVNVPMNDALAAVDGESEEDATLWQHYLRRWTAWNHVRTASCVAAAVLLFVGMVP